MIKEWGFKETSDKVDLEKIYLELFGHPAIFIFAYLGELKNKAPIVYGRLKEWARKNNKMNSIEW